MPSLNALCPLFLLAQAASYEGEIQLAQRLLERGAVVEALEPLKRANALRPDAVDALWMLSVAHLRLQRHADGLPYVESLVALAPESARSHALLAAYLEAAGDEEGAVQSYREALRLEPSNPQTRHGLALLYMARGEDEKARRQFEQILDSYPGDPRSLVPLGAIYVRLGLTKEALDTLTAAVRSAPDSYEAQHYLGALYSTLGRYEMALRHLGLALALREEDPQTLFEIGLVHARREELSEARAHFERARAVRPDDVPTLFQLGQIYQYEGDTEQAVGAYGRVLVLDTDHALARFQLGRLYLEMGRAEDAARSLRRAVELAPENAEAHHQLARAEDALERFTDARRHFERALELAPYTPEPRLSFGGFLMRRGETERGREVLDEFHLLKAQADRLEELEAAVDFDITSPGRKERLVDFLIAIGRTDEALEESRRFLVLGSMEPVHHLLLARAHQARGDNAEALTVLEEARDALPRTAAIDAAYAEALARAGEPERALELLREADPESGDVQRALGVTRAALGEGEAAEAGFRRAVALDPREPGHEVAYASWLVAEGRLDEAADRLRQASNRMPGSAAIHESLAEIYELQGMSAEARRERELLRSRASRR